MIDIKDISSALVKAVVQIEDLKAELLQTHRSLNQLENHIHILINSFEICDFDCRTESFEDMSFDGTYGVVKRAPENVRCRLPRGHSGEHDLVGIVDIIEDIMKDLKVRAR